MGIIIIIVILVVHTIFVGVQWYRVGYRDGRGNTKEGSPSASHNTGSPKCEQCENFDLSKGQYTIECYSCKRYYGDMFTLRAGA